jgi:VWFA-related protein
MILITDGVDEGSIANLKEAVHDAQEADVVIYGIRYQDSMKTVNAGDRSLELDFGMSALNGLAGPTGGQAFDALRRTQLDAAFAAIGEEMRSQYALGFAPCRATHRGGAVS